MSGVVFATGIQYWHTGMLLKTYSAQNSPHRKELLSPQRSTAPRRENLLEGTATFSQDCSALARGLRT